MTEQTKPLLYNPRGLYPFSTKLAKEQCFLCFTASFSNLFWLVEPRIDSEGIEAARDNPIGESIREGIDKRTMDLVVGLPLAFMKYWNEIDRGSFLLTKCWPENYKYSMMERAQEAQRRILGVRYEGNVIEVNFRRSA